MAQRHIVDDDVVDVVGSRRDVAAMKTMGSGTAS